MADLLNNDLYNYIDKKEKVIIDTRKNDKMCRFISTTLGVTAALFVALYLALLSGVISGIISVENSIESDFSTALMTALFVFMLVSICAYPLFARLFYNQQHSMRYILTNRGIYKITGLVLKKCKFVAYNQVTDVSMSVTLLERKFGVGSIGVGTASGNVVGSIADGIYSIDKLSINSVTDYKKIREIIIKNRKK